MIGKFLFQKDVLNQILLFFRISRMECLGCIPLVRTVQQRNVIIQRGNSAYL